VKVMLTVNDPKDADIVFSASDEAGDAVLSVTDRFLRK